MFLFHANFRKSNWRWIPLLGLGTILCFAFLCCGTGLRTSKPNPPLTLQALESFCGLPAPCGRPMACQDCTMTFWGYLDPVNIHSRQQLPEMPYEKFRLVDRQHRIVEVWPQSEDNRAIFEKLARRPTDGIVVTGKLAAVDMPITGQCNQGIKVLIRDASQIEFK
jgi:hypothetical protein